MTRQPSRAHFVRRFTVLAGLAAFLVVGVSLAAAAPADKSTRAQALQARRQTRDELKFNLKKAMTRGEVWTHFWFGGPRECFVGRSYTDSPSLVTKQYAFAAGAAEPSSTTAWQYDRHGNTLVRELRYQGANGPAWTKDTCAYEERGQLHKGKLVYMTVTSSDFPDWPVYRAAYNARDQHELETEEYDFDRNGTVDALGYTRYVYNDDGLLIEQIFETDDDANGTIDYRAAAKASYDPQRRIRSIVKGYYDYLGGPFVPYSTFRVDIDDATRSAVAAEETDYDGDGTSDSTTRSKTISDDANHVLWELYEFDGYGRPDGGGDGVPDFVMETRNEYDEAGNLVHSASQMVDEWGPFFSDDQNTYDGRGRLILSVNTTDMLMVVETRTFTYTRDQHGRITDELMRWEVPWRFTADRTEYRYNGMGNLREMLDSSWSTDEPVTAGYRQVFEYAAGTSGQAGRN
jgi:hypothetical protein